MGTLCFVLRVTAGLDLFAVVSVCVDEDAALCLRVTAAGKRIKAHGQYNHREAQYCVVTLT